MLSVKIVTFHDISVFSVNKQINPIYRLICSVCVWLCLLALDWGGPRREWFELICKALFDTNNQLFTRFSDNNQGLVSLSIYL